MGDMKRISSILILGLLALSAFAILPVSAQPQKGPGVDEVIIEVRASGEVGVGDVATGLLDAYWKSLSPAVYAGLPEDWKQNLKLIKNAGGFNGLVFNPAHDPDNPYIITVGGKQYFNPFAIREVRFAMNFIYSRKYIVDEILLGGGQPMYGMPQPSNPRNSLVEDIYAEAGFSPEGDFEYGYNMIQDALTKAASELGGRLEKRVDPNAPAGFWWYFDGEPVTVTFLIRIEDERHEMGLYIADQIEKCGIKVERREITFAEGIRLTYYTDPKDYLWNIYTEGWSLGQGINPLYYADYAVIFYAPFIGLMPGYQEEGWWQYENDTLDEIGLKIWLRQVESMDEFHELAHEVVRLGVYEAVRIYIVETWEYFPVNKERVTRIAYDPARGLWSEWPLYTTKTTDGTFRIAVESAQPAMFTEALNPIGGFGDVYTMYGVYVAITDDGTESSPVTGEPEPYRVNWTMEKKYHYEDGQVVGEIDVPPYAVMYDTLANEWVEVGEGVKAAVKVVFNLTFSKFHHGVWEDMNDIRYAIAHTFEWATLDEPGDRKYDARYASDLQQTLPLIKGFVFREPNVVEVYHDFIEIQSDAVTATFFVPWTAWPWELWEAMDWIIVNNGSVTGNTYSWNKVEGKEWLNLITEDHVKDLIAALEEMRNRRHVPDALKGFVDPVKAIARYNAAERWGREKGHMLISNGPFYVETYDPIRPYMLLKAFRDPSYPFTSDYWYYKYRVVREVIEKIDAPVSATTGSDITVKVNVIEVEEFPEAGEAPSETAYVTVSLVSPEGRTVFSEVASLVEPGVFQVTIPGSATEGLAEGSYTIKVSAATHEMAPYAEVATQEIVLTAPVVTPTPTPSPTPSPTPAPKTKLYIAAGIVIIIIVVVAVFLLTRKK